MTIAEIDVEELERLQGEGAPVFDVRQPDEYEEAHVPGAILIPLAEVPDRVADFPADGSALIICRSGARSMKAAEFLAGQGVVATNVAGGTLAWLDAGKPTIVGPNPD